MLDFYTNCEGIWITPNKILCGSELLSGKRQRDTERQTERHTYTTEGVEARARMNE